MSYFILIMLEYILKKEIYFVFFFPDVTTKSYAEIIEHWFANAPKMAVNVGDKCMLEKFQTGLVYIFSQYDNTLAQHTLP